MKRFLLAKRFSTYLKKIYGYLIIKVNESRQQIKTFGIILFINYPVYYFIWKFGSVQSYENLPLRISASLLCLPLIFCDRLPERLDRYLPIYWYFSVIFCLPFFFLYMTLHNHGSAAWLLNLLLEILLTFLLLDVVGVILVNTLGFTLAWSIYRFVEGNTVTFTPSTLDIFGALSTIAATFVIGGIFARNRDRIEQAKLETLRAVGATIAHELRTPLSSIQFAIGGSKNYLPFLVDAYEKAKANNLSVTPIQSSHLKLLSNVFDSIESELSYFDTIINMILVNVKEGISTGDFKLISMRDCIQEALHRYPFDHEQEKLIVWSDQNDFLFWGDKMLMIHVIFNLMKNALYFIDKAGKGEITIECGSTEKGNILYFKDTGTGIRPQAIPKLFQRFYTDTQHGTGLGLAYCKMVMTSFRGSIDCESAYGKFTLFKMFFPKVKNIENRA